MGILHWVLVLLFSDGYPSLSSCFINFRWVSFIECLFYYFQMGILHWVLVLLISDGYPSLSSCFIIFRWVSFIGFLCWELALCLLLLLGIGRTSKCTLLLWVKYHTEPKNFLFYEYYYWLVIVNCVLHCELCTSLWIVYFIVNCVLHCELCTSLWIVYFIVNCVLHCELCTSLWIVYFIVNCVLHCELCSSLWIVYFIVNCVFHCELCFSYRFCALGIFTLVLCWAAAGIHLGSSVVSKSIHIHDLCWWNKYVSVFLM